MKNFLSIVFLLSSLLLKGQVAFKTRVQKQTVVVNESFRVQFIIEDAEKVTNFEPPSFSDYRFITGPNIYPGAVASINGTKPSRNYVYTLAAVKPGRFIINGASVTVNGKILRSNDVMVTVISKEEAAGLMAKETVANPDFFLRPGENAYEKIKKNLFLKVMIDKRNCFVGEPVLATFKLYSRLESRSDIVKNPGFYGFAVYDMVNLSDKQVATESINGKLFDVHTIRKVQLYPLQAGLYTIDAMEVTNKVEFSRSVVNKKTEKEITDVNKRNTIVEGVLGNNDNESPGEGTEVFETDISTEPVTINVKPVPEKNRPAGFDGATGHFTIAVTVLKNSVSKNEEDFLEITISGKGNFIQLNAPAVEWPAGIEPFEPTVKDDLDKTTTPLTGRRTFRYPFVCSAAGTYQLHPVSISFFDTDSNTYKTVSGGSIKITVGNGEKITLIKEEKKESITEANARASKIAVSIVIGLVLIVLLYWIWHKKEPAPVIKEKKPAIIPVDELLRPAFLLASATDKEFYTALQQSVWNYFSVRLGLRGSEMNKEALAVRLQRKNIPEKFISDLKYILAECEAGMFINASLLNDKNALVQQAKDILESIDPLVSEEALL